MLTSDERNKKNSLYKQPRVQYNQILKIYENSNYNESCVFRRYVEKLDEYERRKGFEMMDEIDRKFYFNEPEKDRKQSITKLCNILNLNPSDYYNIN